MKSANEAVPVLECQGIERRFGGLVAVTGVDLRIDRGEIFGLVGPNGSGKTTLVNAVTGFYPPQKGRILLNGTEITGMKPHKVARQHVARTFQNLALFNGMSALENILLGRHVHLNPGVVKHHVVVLCSTCNVRGFELHSHKRESVFSNDCHSYHLVIPNTPPWRESFAVIAVLSIRVSAADITNLSDVLMFASSS